MINTALNRSVFSLVIINNIPCARCHYHCVCRSRLQTQSNSSLTKYHDKHETRYFETKWIVWVRICFIGFEQIVFWKWSLQLWSNQSSCKENRAKIIRLQQDSNPWPPRYRFDTPPTELWRLVGIRLRAWWNVLDHIYALQVENTSESDPRSHEATKAVAKKAQNNCEATKLYWIIQKVLSGRGATVTRHRTWVPHTRFP